MTESAAPNYYDLIEIHDRQFQDFSITNGIYYVPVDEDEEDRLTHHHHILLHVFGGRLFFPPIEYPMQILECGYGQGNWAVQMAETYVQSQITAIDIYPAELPEEPDNLERQIWNLNDPLTPTYDRNHYDLIHSRCVGPGIERTRWNGYIRDLARLLKRNGWVQIAEYYYNFQSDSGRLTDGHALQQWGQLYRGAMQELNRDPRVGRNLESNLRDVGLRDVQQRCFRVPIGSWHTDPAQRTIGILNLENIDAFLDSHAIWPFTQVPTLGWRSDQVGWLTQRAKQEARDDTLKLYIELYVAWGRKR